MADRDDRYVLIGINKETGETEPVHPGNVSRVEAERVKRALMGFGVGVTIWDADKWEEKVMADQADLFCPECGAMKEDCPGHAPAAPAEAFRDIEWADELDELAAQQQERDAATDAAAASDLALPDLTLPEPREAALELLELLQGIDFGQGSGDVHIRRMLAAVRDELRRNWSGPAPDPDRVSGYTARMLAETPSSATPRQYRQLQPGKHLVATLARDQYGRDIVSFPYQDEPGGRWWIDLWRSNEGRTTTPCSGITHAIKESGWELREGRNPSDPEPDKYPSKREV